MCLPSGAASSRDRRTSFAQRATRTAQRGFTLIEIILVVVLIAATTALAASVMSASLPGQQLRQAGRELAAQLRYTRAQAIVSGKPQVFTLDAHTREWHAPNRRHGILPREIRIVATGARVEQTRPDEVAVRFFPEGAATGGRIVLVREKAAWQVDVQWLTGEVTAKRAVPPP